MVGWRVNRPKAGSLPIRVNQAETSQEFLCDAKWSRPSAPGNRGHLQGSFRFAEASNSSSNATTRQFVGPLSRER